MNRDQGVGRKIDGVLCVVSMYPMRSVDQIWEHDGTRRTICNLCFLCLGGASLHAKVPEHLQERVGEGVEVYVEFSNCQSYLLVPTSKGDWNELE